MRSFIVPLLLWSYLFSLVLAQRFWGNIYQWLITTLDLSVNQSWALVVFLNLMALVAGVILTLAYLIALKRRENVSTSRHVGSLLCVAAVVLCLKGVVTSAYRNRDRLAAAVGEAVGGKDAAVFDAAQIVDGVYSNRVFGISMQAPKGWSAMSLNEIRRAKYSGAQVISDEDTRRTEELAARQSGNYPLLCLNRYPEPSQQYNPSLFINGYDKKLISDQGFSSLKAYAESFNRVEAPFHVMSGAMAAPVGSAAGYHVHLESRYPNRGTNWQHVYLIEAKQGYLVIVASGIEEEDWATMRQAISTIQLSASR